MSERRGDWMQTYTGKQFWPLDPRPEDVDIQDIAHALSMICRYGGHTREFYSVAQHSVMVAQLVMERGRFAVERAYDVNRAGLKGLLHDSAEAYLGDDIRPLKGALFVLMPREPLSPPGTSIISSYQRIGQVEATLLMAIGEAFGVKLHGMHARVKDCDIVMTKTEARDLLGAPPVPWDYFPGALPEPRRIKPMAPAEAEAAFLETFMRLKGVKS